MDGEGLQIPGPEPVGKTDFQSTALGPGWAGHGGDPASPSPGEEPAPRAKTCPPALLQGETEFG